MFVGLLLRHLKRLQKFVPNVQPCFSTSFPDPHFEGVFSGKRIRANRQPVENTGFSDLSLLCHEGAHMQRQIPTIVDKYVSKIR